MSTLNDEFFGTEKPSGLRTFDAFPKTRHTYRVASSRGGALTVALSLLCLYLTWLEFLQHLDGVETQTFGVEQTIGHNMQINLDVTVAMPCDSLHVNVQDAAMDRILAGEILTKEPTSFDDTNAHRLVRMGDREDHVYDVLARAKKSKFGKSKRRPAAFLHGGDRRACRIYGSMDVNRVQGDFHITVKGHGYGHLGEHIDHSTFNFSHVINELSFGAFYPKLVNPLDDVTATTEDNFYKFQYYLSIVPTEYHSETWGHGILTNQYSVTEQSRKVSHYQVPGIFFKYDIEPINLMITAHRTPFLRVLIRVINIVGGVLVSGNWIYKLVDLFGHYFKRKRRSMDGMINGKLGGHKD